MVYTIVINASLLLISLLIGLYTLTRHTDFPKGMTDDEIENYREVAKNHSKKVRGCALAAIVLGVAFYAIVPALCIIFSVDTFIACFTAVILAFVQMASILLIFTAMSDKLNV